MAQFDSVRNKKIIMRGRNNPPPPPRDRARDAYAQRLQQWADRILNTPPARPAPARPAPARPRGGVPRSAYRPLQPWQPIPEGVPVPFPEQLGTSQLHFPYVPSIDQNLLGGGVGGGVGGGMQAPQMPAAPAPITWSDKYTVPGAPTWWRGLMPSQWTPETEFASIVNSLIPFLSPEDQRQMGSYLSRLFPEGFNIYNPERVQYTFPQEEVTSADRQRFLSAQHAQRTLEALDKVKAASGKEEKDLGPGYKYVRQIAQAMKDFGGTSEGVQTRRQTRDLFSTLDPLLAESKGEALGAYGEIARAMTQPFFSAGRLVDVARDEQGNWTFGRANRKWF